MHLGKTVHGHSCTCRSGFAEFSVCVSDVVRTLVLVYSVLDQVSTRCCVRSPKFPAVAHPTHVA